MLRVLRFEVLPKSQSKHYVHGFYVEAEETESWVKQVVKAVLKTPEGLTSHETSSLQVFLILPSPPA